VNHVDPQVLALLALGEPVASEADRAHLAGCDECARELRQLSAAAHVGRATIGDAPLDRPEPALWAAILAELPADPDATATGPTPVLGGRRWNRLAVTLAAAAMVVVLAIGGVAAWNALRPTDTLTVATTKLESLPAWRGSASGTAVVVESPGGVRRVTIHLNITAPARYRQAWLMTPDLKHFIRIGSVDGAVATLDIPKGVDIGRYNIVDISDEPASTVTQPSDDSIVRGTLAPASAHKT
jgi:hypothetical protein